MSHARLPDPDSARQMISDVVPLLGPRIGAQAHARAEAVRSMLDRGGWPGEPGSGDIFSRTVREWQGWARILSPFFPPGEGPADIDINGSAFRALEAARHSVEHQMAVDHIPPGWPPSDRRWAYYEPPIPTIREASPRQARPALEVLHKALVGLAGALTTSPPRPALLPALHPPRFARLRENASAEAVTEDLAAAIAGLISEYEASLGRTWQPSDFRSAPTWARGTGPLGSFLTDEVGGRYRRATRGWAEMESLARDSFEPGPLYREIARDVHPQVHASYLVISVFYLDEVLELMPDYAEASGQGRRRDPVTVTSSNLSVADTITSIGATAGAIAGHGHPDVAAAIRALAEAIHQSAGLAEEQRVQLLDSLADVADAAAAPTERRKLSRARAAMSMITGAAGASAQIAQAVSDWHSVLGRFS